MLLVCVLIELTVCLDLNLLLAHQIVLAAVSPFLCHVLDVDSASGHSGQTTIVMPDIRKEIVQQLLDFLYTGIMKVNKILIMISYSDEKYLQFDGNIFKGFFSKKTKEKFF